MVSRSRSVVCIVTPGTRRANNGNWRTAARWASMLQGYCKVILQSEWRGEPVDALLALHARRSAPSVAAFSAARAGAPIGVVLTGTDLYKDLPADRDACASLDAASRIVVLQDDAPRLLRPAWRAKSEVIFQSAVPLAAARKARDSLTAVVVGHLREEKDPATLFAAVRLLPATLPIRIRHIGAPLDDDLAKAARALARADSRYRYVGPLPHGLTRAAIKRAHLLIHPSILEGGANVIAEAIASGTPVLASRMSGNIGMLGRNHPGYFDVRDASGLASCLAALCEDRTRLHALERACRARSKLFRPAAERQAVRRLVDRLLA